MKTKTKPKPPTTRDEVSQRIKGEVERIAEKDAYCCVAWLQDGAVCEEVLTESLPYSMAKTLADGLNAESAGKDRRAVVISMHLATYFQANCLYSDSKL